MTTTREDVVANARARTSMCGFDVAMVDLSGAVLVGCDLSDADLFGVNLAGAVLVGANLTGADLRNADLSGANLSGVSLVGADLTGANVNEATSFAGAFYDITTLLPRSLRLPESAQLVA